MLNSCKTVFKYITVYKSITSYNISHARARGLPYVASGGEGITIHPPD